MTIDEFKRLPIEARVIVTCFKPNPRLTGVLKARYCDRCSYEWLGLVHLDKPPEGFHSWWEVTPEWIEAEEGY